MRSMWKQNMDQFLIPCLYHLRTCPKQREHYLWRRNSLWSKCCPWIMDILLSDAICDLNLDAACSNISSLQWLWCLVESLVSDPSCNNTGIFVLWRKAIQGNYFFLPKFGWCKILLHAEHFDQTHYHWVFYIATYILKWYCVIMFWWWNSVSCCTNVKVELHDTNMNMC